jgi:hypothetical protein
MISEPGPRDREPISPELVLVSPPDVARRAREELPLPAAPPRRAQAPARRRPAEAPIRRPRRRLRVALAVVVLAALGAEIWYVTAGRHDTGPSEVSALSPPRTAPPPASLTPRTPTDTQSVPTRSHTTQAPAPPPVVRPARKPKSAKPTPKPKSKVKTKPKPKAPARFVPARTWAWAPSPGTKSYVFQLALNGRTVVRARTKAPRLVLPRSFRFHAGSYRWTVRRIPAPQGGRPLYSSFFVINAAVAAAANR